MQTSHNQVDHAGYRLETEGTETSSDSDIEVDSLCTESDGENTSSGVSFRNCPTSPSPAAFHLDECSIERYERLELPAGHIYDLVEGLLVWRSDMPGDNNHERIVEKLVLILGLMLHWINVGFGQTVMVSDDPEDVQRANRTGKGLRHPHIVLYTSTEHGRAGSSKIRFDTDTPPLAVVEITSRSTRDEDLPSKWVEYALTSIDLYVIIDRRKTKTVRGPFVIVGSLKPFKGAVKASNGYPNSSLTVHNDQEEVVAANGKPIPMSSMYYKRVYKPTEQVECEFFKALEMTPNELASPVFLSVFAKRLKEERCKSEKRVEEAERRASEAEVVIRELKRRVSDAEEKEASKDRSLQKSKRLARDSIIARTKAKKAKKRPSKRRPKTTLRTSASASKSPASDLKEGK